ncbi:MAG: hypothetical protein Q8O40_05170 [Chloroflexota bacterium]|nr:hypothetical protein [Chloroflexota bacterium]
MPTREEMNSLARDILSSYQSRVEGVSQIRQETHAQLKELDRAHNTMAQELRADLSKVKPALDQAEAARGQDEARRARERAQVVAQHRSDVSAQLQELDQAHNAMAQELRADLSKGHADLRTSVSAQLNPSLPRVGWCGERASLAEG